MNKNCEIVQDLLPLFCDGICSETSAEMVKKHLLECEECEEMLKKLQNGSAVNLLQEESKEIISHHNQILKRKSLSIGITIAAFLSVPIFISFIVNLAVGKTLDWFFVVVASLLVVASVTFIPFVVEMRKVFWTIVSFIASVLILLLTVSIFSGGNWFFMAAVSVLFGMSVLFTPVILKQLPIKNDFLNGKIALLSMLIDTMLLYAIIITAGIYMIASYDWSQALLITTFCIIPVWLVFFFFRYTKLQTLTKAGITVIAAGLFSACSDDVISWLCGEAFHVEMWKTNLSMWSAYNMDANIKFIIFSLFTMTGFVLILIGRRIRKNSNS